MCAGRRALVALTATTLFGGFLAACGTERTSSAFCAQMGREIPAIAQPMNTKADIGIMVKRYKRLLARAPLSIQADFTTLTNLLVKASGVNTNDATKVQDLANSSYAANQAALTVRDWIKSTCAIDIATGLTIAPPRTAPPTTLPATTIAATTLPAGQPAATPTVPATTAAP